MNPTTPLRAAFKASPYRYQYQLAEAAGLSAGAVGCMIRGDYRPSIPTARRLARALGVTVRFIYEGDA